MLSLHSWWQYPTVDCHALFTPITYETEVQLASIYTRIIPPNSSYLTVELQPVQQQEGVHDCGLFAVANAVEVCVGGNPEMVQFKQSEMCSHLKNCLEKRFLQPFQLCQL